MGKGAGGEASSHTVLGRSPTDPGLRRTDGTGEGDAPEVEAAAAADYIMRKKGQLIQKDG